MKRGRLDISTVLLGAFAVVLVVVAIPNFVPARMSISRNHCFDQLTKLQEAKCVYALRNGLRPADTVMLSNLVGSSALKQMMECPVHGEYAPEMVVSNLPSCSFAGHDQRNWMNYTALLVRARMPLLWP